MKQCSECKQDFPALYKARTRAHGALCRICWEKIKSRYTGLKAGSTPISTHRNVRRKTISPISDKKAKELREYRKLRDEYLKINNSCEARVESVCVARPVELHHLKPRAYHLCDTDVFMAVCRPCHNWIESNDEEARKLGLKINHL